MIQLAKKMKSIRKALKVLRDMQDDFEDVRLYDASKADDSPAMDGDEVFKMIEDYRAKIKSSKL